MSTVPFLLIDVEQDDKQQLAGHMEREGNGRAISIHLDGYGDKCSAPGHGSPVMLELRNGRPVLVVWADINQEEPTHVIDLALARETTKWFVIELLSMPLHTYVESYSNTQAAPRTTFVRGQAKVFDSHDEAEGFAKRYLVAHNYQIVTYP